MAKKIKRQIRYNINTELGEQIEARHRWVFIIINEQREIKRIREKIYQQLQPIVEHKNLGSELIEHTEGLHYDFFAFSTTKSRIEDPSKIYDSRNFKPDRNLYEKDELKMVKYLESILKN